MNQSDRKEILFGLDKEQTYTNEELFFVDLTPYYKFGEFESSFFGKIIEYKNENLRMLHNSKISFTPDQKWMFEKIKSSKKGKYAISATTSFGKTTVVKEYIKQCQPEKVVYIVPTNSLADELLVDFEQLYEKDGYDVIDTSIEKSKKSKVIFIGTQEKLKEINWFKDLNIDLFVIDEAYKLADEVEGFREVVLNRAFIDYMNQADKYLLLLPLVNKIKGLDAWGFEVLQTDYSPVEKDFIGIASGKYDEVIVETIKSNNSDKKSLVYFTSPTSLETFFNTKLINNELKYEDEWIKRVEKDFHSEWFPVLAYKMGIAIHYGPMPKFIQIKMVGLFNKSDKINTILSTSSLIEGVNTPTKNIFIKDENILKKENRIKYKNLIGRAGRLGITPIGNIYYDYDMKEKFDEANQDWNTLDIEVIVEKEDILEQINRNDQSKSLKIFAEEFDIKEEDVHTLIEDMNISVEELRILINNLIKYLDSCRKNYYPQYVPALTYFYNSCYYKSKKPINNYLDMKAKSKEELQLLSKELNKSEFDLRKEIQSKKYKFLGTLFSATINQSISGVNMNSISTMLEYIKNNNDFTLFKINNSEIISKIVGMVYNTLPYEVVPFLDLVIATDKVFKENNKVLLDDKLLIYLTDMTRKYSLRYFGKIDCSEKERKIIKRMFEYGIPHSEIKEYIQYLVENIPDSFSINHIREAINKNDVIKQNLQKYFF